MTIDLINIWDSQYLVRPGIPALSGNLPSISGEMKCTHSLLAEPSFDGEGRGEKGSTVKHSGAQFSCVKELAGTSEEQNSNKTLLAQ